MAPKLSTTRAVVEHLAELDLNNPAFALSASITIQSIAIATLPVDGAADQHKTLIFIGTHCGKIFLFSLNPTDQDSGTSSNSTARSDVVNADNNSSISYVRSALVSQAPVESINVVANVQKIVLVSDGFIYLVDSLLLQLVKKLGSFKGVSVIARRRILPRRSDNASDDLNYVESSSDREEVLGQLFLKKLGGVGVRSNGLRKSAKQLSFEELMLQKKDSHCMFVILVWKRLLLAELTIDRGNDGSFVVLKEIQCVDDRVVAMVWIDNAVIVGTSNGYTMYSCLTGQNRLIFSLPDLCCPPQLKFLAKERNVLLMLDNVGISVNADGQPVGGSLVFGCAPDAVGELGSNIIVAENGKAKIYHKKSSKCVQTVTFATGRVGQCIVVDEENGSGKFVIVGTPSKVICYQKVAVERQIKDLLRKKSFKEAISLVEELESEGELTNEMLSVFHAQVGFLLLFNLHFEEAVDHFLLSETMQPSELFPFIMRDPNRWSLLVPRNRYWGLHPPPALLEKIVDDGLMGIQRGIFLKKAGVETAIDDEFLLNPLSRADLLESAIKSFIRYLQVFRGKDLTPSMKEGVDTLLMYLYRALNRVDDMERLASVENSCVVEELETLLNDSGHLRTLAFLYASKGMDSKALSVWRILARNYSSGFWKHSSGDNESETISSQETVAIEASKILEESSDQDLILEHLGWVADISQVIAVHILTSEKRTILLSPDQVIASIDSRKVEILQRYLQWLIEDQGSDNTQHHTTYALLLAKSAVEAYEREKASTSSEARSIDEKGIGDSEWHSIFQSPISDRLQIFLHSSDLYDPEEVLDQIEKSELWLEKAILYRKLGQESLVLEILALKLEDCEAAEQYCAEIGRPDAYMQLLELYLNPKGGKEPMFKSAVRLLHNHGESLDPLQVLERLSSDMPLQLASDTILRMLRARLHHHRQGQIVHNMSRAMDIDASMARLEERSRHVLINDESLCDSCHARLGTKLFAMYPDDTVVCYKCFRRQGESVSVSGRDFKQDAIIKQGWLVTR